MVRYKPVKKESDCVSTGVEIVSCEKCISPPDLMIKNAFSGKLKKICQDATLRYATLLRWMGPATFTSQTRSESEADFPPNFTIICVRCVVFPFACMVFDC